MYKRKPLDTLKTREQTAVKSTVKPTKKVTAAQPAPKPERRLLGVHVSEAAYWQFKELCTPERVQVRYLMREGIHRVPRSENYPPLPKQRRIANARPVER